MLKTASAASRTIKTLKAGALTSFDTTNIVKADLGVTTDQENLDIIGFVRGESAYNKEGWKLGDIFRSAPVTVGTPSAYFKDSRDGANAFAAHRTGNARTSANGKRAIVAGANDGQLHAFRTSDGVELWSFIPPNLRTKLKNIAHKAHPTGLSHQYFVDGPVSVADVWLGTGDGTTKSASDWKTLLVFGQGRGSTSYLWSSSATCDSDFDNNYSATTALLLRLLGPRRHEHGKPRLQVEDHAHGGPVPLPGRPLEQDVHPPGEDQRQREVGRVHGRGAQPLQPDDLRGRSRCGGLRQARQGHLRDRPCRRQRPVGRPRT